MNTEYRVVFWPWQYVNNEERPKNRYINRKIFQTEVFTDREEALSFANACEGQTNVWLIEHEEQAEPKEWRIR